MPVRLIPGHPLGTAGGLILCVTALRLPGDYVGFFGGTLDGAATLIRSGSYGPGFASSASQGPYFSLKGLSGTTTGYTAFSFQQIPVASQGGQQNPFDGDYTASGARMFQNRIDNNVPQFILFNTAGTPYSVSTATLPSSAQSLGWKQSVKASISAGVGTISINGQVAGSVSWSGTLQGLASNGNITLGSSASAGLFLGPVFIGLLYNNEISTAADEQLAAEPFCMLEPARRQVLYYFQGNPLSGLATLGPFSARGAISGKNALAAKGMLGPFSAQGAAAGSNAFAAKGTFGPIGAVSTMQGRNSAVGVGTLGPLGARGAAEGKNAFSGDGTLGPLGATGVIRLSPIPSRISSLPVDVRMRSLPMDN